LLDVFTLKVNKVDDDDDDDELSLKKDALLVV